MKTYILKRLSMKNFNHYFLIVMLLVSVSCSKSSKPTNSLYKILYSSEYGGTAFEFYEIFTEEKEFLILLDDSDLKKKIKAPDIKTSNFIILNMGQKNSGGYSIGIKKIINTKETLQVYIDKKNPKNGAPVTMSITNPIAIVKINSKKKIQIME